MKQYNINLPQDELGFLKKGELDNMFEEKESLYGHGNHLSMSKHVSGTKGRIYQDWDRYRLGRFWKMMNRKLESYVGWNVDDARSDFYKWCKENRIPGSTDITDSFNRKFGLNSACIRRYYRWNSYVVGDDKIIRKVRSDYELRKMHDKYYNNVGHHLLGYCINPELLKHNEIINVIVSTFGKNIIPAIGGGLLDEETINRFSEVNTNNIFDKYFELNDNYIDSVFKAVYSPDIWERKSKSKLIKEWRQRMTDKARKKNIKKSNKKSKKDYYDQVYAEGISQAKFPEGYRRFN